MTRSRPMRAVLAAVFAISALNGCSSHTSGVALPHHTADAPAASLDAEAGLPPDIDPATAHAYITALESINPDIVHGDPEKALDRGRNLCSTITRVGTTEQQAIASADMRFTSPDHPEGFGEAVAAQIVQNTRTHLCP